MLLALQAMMTRAVKPHKTARWFQYLWFTVGMLGGLVGAGPSVRAADAGLFVDFRYTPAWWATSICLPDDPQKTLVSPDGQLLYDFPGPLFPHASGRGFQTTVGVVVTEAARPAGQELLDPRVPIVRTRQTAPGLEITQEAFATLPDPTRPKAAVEASRVDNGDVLRNWAQPMGPVQPGLAHIAVHMDGPIAYALRVKPGSRYRVVLGLCEGYHDKPKARVLDLKVEGAPTRTVDAVAELGRNRAGAFVFDAADTDDDGRITVRVEANPAGWDGNTILNALWVFAPDTRVEPARVLAGEADGEALAVVYPARQNSLPRMDVILVRIKNTGTTTRTLDPFVILKSEHPVVVDRSARSVRIRHQDTLAVSRPIVGVRRPYPQKWLLQLAPVTLGAGEETRFSLGYAVQRPLAAPEVEVERVREARARAIAFWRQAPLPFDRVKVPDPRIQALLDSSIRNIWQARDIKQGVPVFQVGPTCYRGLWVVDGAFLLEAATLLGAEDEARNGILYTLGKQKKNGAFEVLGETFYKENGIVLWTCVRHAMLTQDKAWLKSIWPRLEKTVAYIKELRRRSRENDTPLDDGLIPPGFIDGGLGGHDRPEYSNTYWNLLGLKAAIQAARWLGKDAQAGQWEAEYKDFMATFRRAARRDRQKDGEGHSYLPTLMGEAGAPDKTLPQRAQWAFCHAVYPGQIFPENDPLVSGNLAMLKATEQEDMVVGTGWDPRGIWNYFASFYGHAWLWNGDGAKAARCLYALANHASPLLAWREEQNTRDMPWHFVGDMPHNWASAEFIRLTVHLLALDRDRELHLFEGLPRAWAGPGMVTELNGIATPFGPLTLHLRINKDGSAAELNLQPLNDPSCEKIVVHLAGWAPAAGRETIELAPGEAHRLNIRLR